MALTTVNITGRIAAPNDANLANCTVEFKLTGFDTDAATDTTVPPVTVVATVDASGDIDVDLYPNEDSTRTRRYNVATIVRDADQTAEYPMGIIEVPTATGPHDLNDLLQVDPNLPVYQSIQDALDAQDVLIADKQSVENRAASFVLSSISGDNTITASAGASLTAYAAGQSFVFEARLENTGAATLNINSIGAIELYGQDDKSLQGGALVRGDIYEVVVADGATRAHVRGVGRVMRALDLQVMSQLFLNRNDVDTVEFSTSGNGELIVKSISTPDGDTVEELARFDKLTGALRTPRGMRVGPSSTDNSEVYSGYNEPKFAALAPEAVEMHRVISPGFHGSVEADLDTIEITDDGIVHRLGMGDYGRDLYINADDVVIDAQFMITGSFRIFVGSGHNAILHIGDGNTFLAGFANPRVDIGAGAVLELSKIDASLFSLTVHTGTATTSAVALPAFTYHISAAGQSLGARLPKATIAGMQSTSAIFGDAFLSDGAQGQSSVLQRGGSDTNYWWNADTSTPGPRALDWETASITNKPAAQPAVTDVLWIQGLGDVSDMASTGDNTTSRYRVALGELFAWMITQSGNAALRIWIEPLGATNSTVPGFKYTGIREAQVAVAATSANYHMLPPRYDLDAQFDDAHLNIGGMRKQGVRIANAMENVINSATNAVPPAISAIARDDARTMTVTIDSTSIRKPGDYEYIGGPPEGLAFYANPASEDAIIDATALTPETIAWNGADVVFTFADDLPATVKVSYPHGPMTLERRAQRFIRENSDFLPLAQYAGGTAT